MAGWQAWNMIQVATGSSVARTVLETLWPSIDAIARADGWPPVVWVDRMMSVVSEAICVAKQAESLVLDQDLDLQAVVRAGEMWASSRFHQGVLRFETVEEAQAWLIGAVRQAPPAMRALPAGVVAAIADIGVLQPLAPGAANQQHAWANVDYPTYIRWLFHTKVGDESATNVCNGLVAYVCGMCKMGNMTREWMNSRLQQIKREAQNNDLVMTKTIIEKVWDFYGVSYPPPADAFEGFFGWLEQRCEEKHMTRLYITAQQSAEQGCTVLNLIADAYKECDDFHWERFAHPNCPAETTIQSEIRAWGADYDAMKANPWLRFSGTVGRSPIMANLGYLAKQLLARARGHTSVTNYQGLDLGNVTIRHRAWIDRIVREYAAKIAEPDATRPDQPILRPAQVVPLRHRRLHEPIRRPVAAPLVPGAPPIQINRGNQNNLNQPGGGMGAIPHQQQPQQPPQPQQQAVPPAGVNPQGGAMDLNAMIAAMRLAGYDIQPAQLQHNAPPGIPAPVLNIAAAPAPEIDPAAALGDFMAALDPRRNDA